MTDSEDGLNGLSCEPSHHSSPAGEEPANHGPLNSVVPKPGPGLWRSEPLIPVEIPARPASSNVTTEPSKGSLGTSAPKAQTPLLSKTVSADRGGVALGDGAKVGIIYAGYVPPETLRVPACLRPHTAVVAALRGRRSALTESVLPFWPPRRDAPWHPQALWDSLTDPSKSGSILLSGHGGIGKTRTLFEVAALASQDGWDVLHLRGSNVSSAVDYLKERSESTTHPALIVIDYLNLYQTTLDMDLLQELVAAARHPSPKLAVITSVRTGWWNNHEKYPGLKSLQHVQLTPTSQDLYDVCAAVAANTAPTAIERRGLGYVLSRTGLTRPVLVRLIATIVEDHITSDLVTDTLVSGDLSDYLRDRLSEDHLAPRASSETPLLPSTVDDTVHATAVVLATTPTTVALASTVASTVLASLEEHAAPQWTAQHLVSMLINMGWLIPTEAALTSVHDVVVDHVVESVLFPDGTVAHPAHLTTFLNAAADAPAALSNALVTLERIYNEREARDELSATLKEHTDTWVRARAGVILSRLTEDPINGSVTASALLVTPLLSGPETTWEHLARPLLDELGSHSAARDLLTTAAIHLPNEYSSQIVEQALAWLKANPPDGADRLLRHLLDRDDVPPESVGALLDLSFKWSQTYADSLGADFLLTRLLTSPFLDAERTPATLSCAIKWLVRYSNHTYASHLLSAVLHRKDLSSEQSGTAIRLGETWLEQNAAHPSAAFVVPPFLSRPELTPMQRDNAADIALQRVSSSSDLEASYMLKALLGRTDLDKRHVEAACAATHAWLKQNPGPEASYMLQALLGRTDLDKRQIEAACAATHAWLKQNPGPETNYVLQALLGRTDLDKGQIEAACAATHAWLKQNPGPEASYVLPALLGRTDLDKGQIEAACAATHAWLKQNPGPETNYVLQALLGRTDLDKRQIEAACAATHAWLKQNPGPETNYVLQALLGRTDLDKGQIEAACAATHAWLKQNPGPEASYVLPALLGRTDLDKGQIEAACAATHAWLKQNPGPEASNVVQALLGRSDLDKGEIERLISHGAIQASIRLTRQVLAQASLTVAQRNLLLRRVAEAASSYTGPAGRRSVMLLVRTPDLDPQRLDLVIGTAKSWITRHMDSLQERFILHALLERADLTSSNSEIAAAMAIEWVGVHATRTQTSIVLSALLRRRDLLPKHLESVLDSADIWFSRNMTQDVAAFVLRDLLTQTVLTPAQVESGLAIAGKWVEINDLDMGPTRTIDSDPLVRMIDFLNLFLQKSLLDQRDSVESGNEQERSTNSGDLADQ